MNIDNISPKKSLGNLPIKLGKSNLKSYQIMTDKQKIQTDEFIIKSKKLFGNKFNYCKTIYKTWLVKLILICDKHNDFEISPKNHLRSDKGGCKLCAKEKLSCRKTMDEFIRDARVVHGNMYDYSKAIYVTYQIPLLIICPIDGEFLQKPSDHLGGSNCPICHGKSEKKTQNFINKAKIKFGDIFDYSSVIFTTNNKEININCLKHGIFSVYPENHIRQKFGGCNECCRQSLIGNKFGNQSKETFLIRALVKRGDRYSYDKMEYIDYISDIIVTCKLHGDFYISPLNHMRNKLGGCLECAHFAIGNTYRLSKEEFLAKAISIHHNKYKYDKSIYINYTTHITITCLIHGDFLQTPCTHLRGSGCRKCAGNNPKTTEQFIEEAKNIHAMEYNYNKVNYINCETKVTIICPEHGDFQITPNNHLQGGGCKECGLIFNAISRRITIDTFKQRAIITHGDKYDYSQVIFVDTKTKIKIIHKECNSEFYQNPLNHIGGHGCPICRDKSEKMCREICEELTQLKFPKVRPIFLLNKDTNRNLEIDCYCEDLNLAIEYNDHTDKFHHQTDEIYQKQLKRDQLKKNLCEINQTLLIYVPMKYSYRTKNAMREYIKQQFIKHNISMPEFPINKIKLKLKNKPNEIMDNHTSDNDKIQPIDSKQI